MLLLLVSFSRVQEQKSQLQRHLRLGNALHAKSRILYPMQSAKKSRSDLQSCFEYLQPLRAASAKAIADEPRRG